MLEQRDLGRGSIITGSSVQNCRVERIHIEVCAGVLCFYSQLFAEFEENEILDPLNICFVVPLLYLPTTD